LKKQKVKPEAATAIARSVMHRLHEKSYVSNGIIKNLKIHWPVHGKITLTGELKPFVFESAIFTPRKWDPPSISQQIRHATYLWHWKQEVLPSLIYT
jgi:hypothetical protein